VKNRHVEPRSYQEVLDRGYIPNRDFRVVVGNLENIDRCLLIAPHGGAIEPGTTEIMHAVADLGGWAFYHFDGTLRRRNKDRLHITSTRFDEPQLTTLLTNTRFVMSFHGQSGSTHRTIYVGGLYKRGRRVLLDALNADLEPISMHAVDATRARHAEEIKGASPRNITNQGQLRTGVQLEFSRGARLACFESLSHAGRQRPRPTLATVARSIHRALAELTA
jgi:phage replication-related protein YjqB (UPF0714/DUF867 family)